MSGLCARAVTANHFDLRIAVYTLESSNLKIMEESRITIEIHVQPVDLNYPQRALRDGGVERKEGRVV